MEFSKEHIVSKHFSKKTFGGLSEFEVRDFLHVLAEQMRHFHQQNRALRKELEEKEALIADYRDREHILKEAITNAEKWAEKIKQEAEKHSQLILEKAQNESESLIQSARQSLQTVYNDIADLKRLQIQFKTGLKAALQVQLDLLEQDNLLNPGLGSRNFDRDEIPEKKQTLQEDSLPPKKNKESPKKSKESMATTPLNDKDLHSLKESLSALNKSFS